MIMQTSWVRYFLGENIVITVVLQCLLLFTCLIGDNLVSYLFSRLGDHLFLRALCDSATHGLVALWSWGLVEQSNFNCSKLINCFVCAILAIHIDLDHFLAARSFRLKDALSLTSRPPFHLTTIIPVVVLPLWILGTVLRLRYLKTLSLIVFIAVFSHHLRDATRHGLWLSPFPSTSPVPYWLYVVGILLLPHLVRLVHVQVQSNERTLNSDSEVEIMLPL